MNFYTVRPTEDDLTDSYHGVKGSSHPKVVITNLLLSVIGIIFLSKWGSLFGMQFVLLIK